MTKEQQGERKWRVGRKKMVKCNEIDERETEGLL